MPESIRNEAYVATYWDFENIHAALVDEQEGEGAYRRSRYKVQDALVELSPVVEFMASLGNIVLHRAYANWQWLWKYRDELLQHSVDLIQLFPRGQHAKNGADIRLALDAIEDVGRYRHITHVVVIGGDSDYIALAQKLRHAGKHVIGIGPQGSTNGYWLRACNEFKYYRTLLGKAGAKATEVLAELREESDPSEAKALLREAVRRLAASRGDEWALKATLRPMMTRLAPTFDEGNYGYASFTEFLNDCSDLVEIRKDKNDHLIRIRGDRAPVMLDQSAADPQAETGLRYVAVLKDWGFRHIDPKWRHDALQCLAKVFDERPDGKVSSFEEMQSLLGVELAARGLQDEGSLKSNLRKMLYRLFAFEFHGPGRGISLRPRFQGNSLPITVEEALLSGLRKSAPQPLDVDGLVEVICADDGECGQRVRALLAADAEHHGGGEDPGTRDGGPESQVASQ